MNCCQPGGRSDGSSVSDEEGEDGFSGADDAASDGALADLVESWPASDGVLSAGGVSGDGFSGSAGFRSLNMNSTSSETLSSITWGSTKTTAGRMLRK